MVVKKCSGLPLAIITVGATMRGSSDITKWTIALEDLNSKDPNNQTMDIKDDVFKCLKFSYNRLDEKQRKCFLCCALYPEDWEIPTKDLIDFWIMDGLVEGTNMQNELVKGQYILNILKDHCLLETVDKVHHQYDVWSDGVKMHDMMREMALRLTNKSFLVKGPGLKELPNKEEWKRDLKRASFMDSKIVDVSISPICPKLSTLILRNGGYGDSLKSVTHDFFVHMKSLKVLDLQCHPISDLKSLPDSISDLVNLRALLLGLHIDLKKIPSLAKLVLLRRLDLKESGIEELPEGIEMLVNLRCLDLSWVSLKKRIPIGLISKFTLLEELYLGGIKVNKVYKVGRGECFAKELLSLKHLENLSVTFHCVSDYVSYVGSPKFNGLKCFFLATGEPYYPTRNSVSCPSRATTKLGDLPDEHTAFFILPKTKRLIIQDFDDVIRLKELGWLIKDVEMLVSIKIVSCKSFECIWSSEEFSATGTSSTCWVQSLERIEILFCPKLYTIFEGIPIFSGVFCLKELSISECHSLKKVFPSSRLLKLLQNLQYIAIESCDELEELIGDEEEETETSIAIPRLKNLRISRLPKLKKICRGAMICDSLKCLTVYYCTKLKRLPQIMGEEQSTPPPALRSITGDRKWWDSLEWVPAYPKSILQPFFEGNPIE